MDNPTNPTPSPTNPTFITTDATSTTTAPLPITSPKVEIIDAAAHGAKNPWASLFHSGKRNRARGEARKAWKEKVAKELEEMTRRNQELEEMLKKNGELEAAMQQLNREREEEVKKNKADEERDRVP